MVSKLSFRFGVPRTNVIKSIICFVLAILILLSTIVMGLFDKYYNKMQITDVDDSAINEYLKDSDTDTINEDDPDVINVLLIGSDNRTANESARSDSVIIASLNTRTNKIVLTSILRDSYVNIPGYGMNRINAAFTYGGVELVIATLQDNFGIKLDKYAQVDFQSFQTLIDTLGGVDVELTADEANYLMGIKTDVTYVQDYHPEWGLHEGTNTLTGEQALLHARNRSMGTDFERTRRQRDIITALIQKVKGASGSEIMDIVNLILPDIKTNLTKTELVSLASKAGKYADYTMEQYSFPMAGTYKDITVSGMAVLEVDCNANSQVWYDAVYGDD